MAFGPTLQKSTVGVDHRNRNRDRYRNRNRELMTLGHEIIELDRIAPMLSRLGGRGNSAQEEPEPYCKEQFDFDFDPDFDFDEKMKCSIC